MGKGCYYFVTKGWISEIGLCEKINSIPIKPNVQRDHLDQGTIRFSEVLGHSLEVVYT